MSTTQQHGILLESGTNELEILVFTFLGQRYGVNVAKVREVIEPVEVTAMPDSHESVLGVFQLRDTVSPLIDLQRALGSGAVVDVQAGKIIIMEFNDVRVGFLVENVEQIYRVSWESVAAIPDIAGVNDAPLTSVAHINDNMVLMLDFEKIVFDIGGVDLFEEHAKRMTERDGRDSTRILFAEDSNAMRALIQSNLHKAGYTNITLCVDGQNAWDKLESDVSEHGRVTFDILITDIEMPRIDGLHLTRRIKDNPQMNDLPIVIFSSLVSDDNEKKCKAVGADAQITKPQLDQLVDLIDSLVAVVDAPS